MLLFRVYVLNSFMKTRFNTKSSDVICDLVSSQASTPYSNRSTHFTSNVAAGLHIKSQFHLLSQIWFWRFDKKSVLCDLVNTLMHGIW